MGISRLRIWVNPNMTKIIEDITQAEIEALRTTGHVVAVRPRKGIVVVDGFKRYRMVKKNPNENVIFERTNLEHTRCGGFIYKNAILQYWCALCNKYVLDIHTQIRDVSRPKPEDFLACLRAAESRKKIGEIVDANTIWLRTIEMTRKEYNKLRTKLLAQRIPSKYVGEWLLVPLENWKQAMWTLKGWEGQHRLAESNPTGRTVRKLSKFPRSVRPAIKQVMETRRPQILEKGKVYITPARDGTQVYIGTTPSFVPFNYQDDE